jgi:hypothetical protein
MGSFSIWHWIVVILLFSPFFIGVLLMGLQKRVLIKHTQSGLVKSGYVGFCWTYWFFGWLVPVFRGEIGIGVLHLILTICTFGLFQIIMAFLYNKQFMTRQLTSGWVLSDTEELNILAKTKLGIAQ